MLDCSTPPNQPILQAVNIKKTFDKKTVLQDISFDLYAGQTLTLMGPSGSGKTTLLRILAGLEKPTHGKVFVKGQQVTELAPEKRGLGFVFQHYALFPHMTVYENLAFPLRLKHLPNEEINKRVAQALDIVGMTDFQNRKPAKLSGGEAQRIAIMRAVIYRPSILLLDEPFAALDRHLLEQLQTELWKIRDLLQIAMILITHDSSFGMSISDQLMILNNGRVEQMGTPQHLYKQPVNKFVAQFLDSINLISSQLIGDNDPTTNDTKSATIGIRPNQVKISHNHSSMMLKGTLLSLKYRGSKMMAEVFINPDTQIWGEITDYEAQTFNKGDIVSISWDKKDALFLSE